MTACPSFHKRRVLRHFCSGMRRNQSFRKVAYFFRLLGFFGGGGLFFFCFSYLFSAVIDLLLGFLPVEKRVRKHHRDGPFLPWSSRKSCPEFSLKFLSMFLHISDSIESITLIWVSLERCFPPEEVKRR